MGGGVRISGNLRDLARGIDALTRVSLHRLANDVGEEGLRDINQHFRDERGPEGAWAPRARPWEPAKARAADPRKHGRPPRDTSRLNKLLQQTTLLRRGIAYRLIGGLKMAWGTNRDYAAVHQFGSKPYVIRPKHARALRIPAGRYWVFATKVKHPGVPARPFLWLSHEAIAEIRGLIADHLRRTLP